MTSKRLKIGLVGAGHLGKIHLRCLLALSEIWQVVGFFDIDEKRGAAISIELGVPFFDDLDALLAQIEAVDIVTPTDSHFELAKKAIENGLHFFVEKPVTATVAEGRALFSMLQKSKIKSQVGHVERFNPAFLALKNRAFSPVFVESHRLATFQPRGTEVSVVLDLMIHDLDLVLHLVKSPVAAVSASGVAVLSDTPDIANARVEFENGCVANLTASRMSMKQMRKMRLFQRDAYLSLDFLEKKAQIVRLFEPGHPDLPPDEGHLALETARGTRILHASEPDFGPVNAIQLELETFGRAILDGSETAVPFSDGLAALELAQRILDEIELRQRRFGG